MSDVMESPQAGVDVVGSAEKHKKLTNSEMLAREEVLMKDQAFLIEVAEAADTGYRTTEIEILTAAEEPVPDFLHAPLFSDEERAVLISSPTEDPASIALHSEALKKKNWNLAGFYAISDGLGVIAENHPNNPTQMHDTLDQFVSETESERDRNLMCRFAHVTWAAGQPFRGRETRAIMKPWDLLSDADKIKDIAQIRSAAKALSSRLTP